MKEMKEKSGKVRAWRGGGRERKEAYRKNRCVDERVEKKSERAEELRNYIKMMWERRWRTGV